MRNMALIILLLANACKAVAAPPNDGMVKSCLLAHSADSTVTTQDLDTNEIGQEDDYAEGFNATYIFKYQGKDVGYGEKNADHALIYSGRIYRVSKAAAVGDNRGVKPSGFNPTLAQWLIVKTGVRQYLCASFNFDGLGQSGSFQNVHGGYLLDTKTRHLYFAVREVKF